MMLHTARPTRAWHHSLWRIITEPFQARASTLQLILDNWLDAVVTIDAAGIITGWNPRAETIFGWSSSEAIGQPLADTIIPPQFREAHKAGLQRYLSTQEGFVLNRRI